MSNQYRPRKPLRFTMPGMFGIALMACSATEDSANHSDAGFAPNPSSSIELRAIELASGLTVDVFAPAAAFDSLPESPTASQLCEDFILSITATFDENQEPVSYAASATWRPMEGTSDPSLVQGLAGYLAPLFPDFDIPTDRRFGGVESNPIAVFPIALSSPDTQFPEALAIFHHRTKAPMALFNHSPMGQYRAFPRTWHDAAGAAGGPSVEVWSRYIEGAESLAQCDGYSEVIAKTMNLSVVEELASCGDLMAWPYSLPDPTVGSDTQASCLMSPHGFGVTLSPLTDNPWGTIACPRPAEAQFTYACFGQ